VRPASTAFSTHFWAKYGELAPRLSDSRERVAEADPLLDITSYYFPPSPPFSQTASGAVTPNENPGPQLYVNDASVHDSDHTPESTDPDEREEIWHTPIEISTSMGTRRGESTTWEKVKRAFVGTRSTNGRRSRRSELAVDHRPRRSESMVNRRRHRNKSAVDRRPRRSESVDRLPHKPIFGEMWIEEDYLRNHQKTNLPPFPGIRKLQEERRTKQMSSPGAFPEFDILSSYTDRSVTNPASKEGQFEPPTSVGDGSILLPWNFQVSTRIRAALVSVLIISTASHTHTRRGVRLLSINTCNVFN